MKNDFLRWKLLPPVLKRPGLLTLLWCGLEAGTACGGGMLDSLPFIDIRSVYHERRGRFDLGGGHSEEVDKKDLITFGAGLGKRWRLSPGLRVQFTADINYGSVVDDTLYPGNGTTPTVLTTVLIYGSVLADVQCFLHPRSNDGLFLHAGTGLHVANVHENETYIDDPNQPLMDPYLVHRTRLSASVHGGLGGEMAVSQTLGFALVYSLRWWFPVRYAATRDLFPMAAIPYRERFYSHELDLQILVKRY